MQHHPDAVFGVDAQLDEVIAAAEGAELPACFRQRFKAENSVVVAMAEPPVIVDADGTLDGFTARLTRVHAIRNLTTLRAAFFCALPWEARHGSQQTRSGDDPVRFLPPA